MITYKMRRLVGYIESVYLFMTYLTETLQHQQPQQHHHPGKINLSEFANVTDAIARMKLVTGGGKEPPSGNAPPPPPPRLAKVRTSFDGFVLLAFHFFLFPASSLYFYSVNCLSSNHLRHQMWL